MKQKLALNIWQVREVITIKDITLPKNSLLFLTSVKNQVGVFTLEDGTVINIPLDGIGEILRVVFVGTGLNNEKA